MPQTNKTSESTSEPLILVVDDEPALVDAISYSLRREGWRVIAAYDGLEAVEMQRAEQPDLLVLDVMLPGLDGIQVCRTIRHHSSVPILFLSAKGEDVDRILGLEIGGDDYLTKPFVMRELVARVRAQLRRLPATQEKPADRQAAAPAPAVGDDLRVLTFDDGRVVIDQAARTVLVDGKKTRLKNREFELLDYLARRPNVAVSREQLLRDVWQHSVVVDTRTVDVHVRGLRQKLERSPAEPLLIETVRGHGYRLNAS
ncbi:MAG: response regulator transcription factor [Thermomicrobiales bacterium]|nr:response regulator transcription factor [Thermomicrobiales bacterium]